MGPKYYPWIHRVCNYKSLYFGLSHCLHYFDATSTVNHIQICKSSSTTYTRKRSHWRRGDIGINQASQALQSQEYHVFPVFIEESLRVITRRTLWWWDRGLVSEGGMSERLRAEGSRRFLRYSHHVFVGLEAKYVVLCCKRWKVLLNLLPPSLLFLQNQTTLQHLTPGKRIISKPAHPPSNYHFNNPRKWPYSL